jgi:hypothetical protein
VAKEQIIVYVRFRSHGLLAPKRKRYLVRAQTACNFYERHRLQDELSSEGEGQPNVVEVPISVLILDENDNPPAFRGTPYKASINEDTPVGTTVFRALEAVDADLVILRPQARAQRAEKLGKA